jgi:hypothetical protein
MRILLSFLQALRRHPIPACGFWAPYMRAGLAEAGHETAEIPEVDWAEGLACEEGSEALARWKKETWSRAVDWFAAERRTGRPVDVALFYLFPCQVDAPAVKAIQDLGIPCVNFFCDNVREYTAAPPEFGCFALNWVPEHRALEYYRKAGLPHVEAPMPAWVPPEARTWDHPENHGVTFIGSRDGQRMALFERVLELGLAMEIRGAAWEPGSVDKRPQTYGFLGRVADQFRQVRHSGLLPWTRKILGKARRAVPLERFAAAVRPRPEGEAEYLAVTQQSQVVLGVNRYPSLRFPFDRPDTYSRLRDVEAPMMGACYLTEWAPGLDAMYDLGKEIETYRTAEELVEKARALLADRERRKRLRFAGQRRALADHTIARAVGKCLTALGLRP